MQVKNVGSNEPPYHVPSGIGRALVLAGVAVEILPAAVPKLSASLDWSAIRGPAIADTEQPPYIAYSSCPACGKASGIMYGPTVHITQKIFHCNGFETVPAHVAEKYVALYKDFKRRQERKRNDE
jgi:hypothetical protein